MNTSNSKIMKILVIDDATINLQAARAQFSEHEVTTANSYDEGREFICKEKFDVVLTDLLLPGSDYMCRMSNEVGKEMPVGIFLALLAAKHNVPLVGLLTSNHHTHPGCACLDHFCSKESRNVSLGFLTVNNSKVFLCNDGNLSTYKFFADDLSFPIPFGGESWSEAVPEKTKALFARKKAEPEAQKVEAKHWSLLLSAMQNFSVTAPISVSAKTP